MVRCIWCHFEEFSECKTVRGFTITHVTVLTLNFFMMSLSNYKKNEKDYGLSLSFSDVICAYRT